MKRKNAVSKPEFLQQIREGLRFFRKETAQRQRQEADVDAQLKAEQKQADEAPNLVLHSVQALAIDPATPSTLYAGTHGDWRMVRDGGDLRRVAVNGMFKSTNGGATWSAIDTGLTNPYVEALVIDPATPSTLYAGTGGGVFKSMNGGATWHAINTGLTDLDVLALAIDPQHPTTLYAGMSDSVRGGVFKTTDGGASWSKPAKGLSSILCTMESDNLGHPKITALAIDPQNPTTLYAGTYFGDVFKTTNGGATWSSPSQYFTHHSLFGTREHRIHIGLRGYPADTLAIDPATPSTLYAVTHGQRSGIFKSIDGGATWSAASVGMQLPKYVYHPPAEDEPYAYVNYDSYALAIDPATPSTLYAGTDSGIFKSTNSGASWYWSGAASNGLTNSWVYALAIDPQHPTALYAGTSGGVFKSADGGVSWRRS